MKSVCIWSYYGPHFPAFGLNTNQNNSEYGHFFTQWKIPERCLVFLPLILNKQMPSGLGHSFSYSIHIKEFTDQETYSELFQTSKMERPAKIYVPVTSGDIELIFKFKRWAILLCIRRSKGHCMKSVQIRSLSGPHFPAFGLNTEIYSVFSPKTGKYVPEKTLYLDNLLAVGVQDNKWIT